MATQPEEFQELAAELIGDEFAPFAKDAVIKMQSGFSHAAQDYAIKKKQTVSMIRTEFKNSQTGVGLVQTGDYKLVGEYVNFDFIPEPDNCTLKHDGIDCEVIDVKIDPAKATVKLHVRRS